MPTSVSRLTKMPISAVLMKSCTAEVSRHARDEIALPRLSVFGERQPLEVLIEHQPQIVRDPFADPRRQVLFHVGADAADNRNQQDGAEREPQQRRRVVAEDAADNPHQRRRQPFTLQDIVDNDGDRPRLEHVRQCFADHGEKCEKKSLPVWPEQAAEQALVEARR